MRFTKMHGCGNEYVLVDCRSGQAGEIADPAETAVRVSDRRRGIGADGLILVQPSAVADMRMEIYNADGVTYEPLAERQIASYEKAGLSHLPMCMAKTHLSLSHDPKLKGVPGGFTVPVTEVRASAGAGFLYPLLGTMRTMPGLPSKPAFLNIDLDDDGEVVGMF